MGKAGRKKKPEDDISDAVSGVTDNKISLSPPPQTT